MLCGQIGMSCLASFGGLPSDLTHYSGCAELPIGDTIHVRVIGTVVDTLYTCYILTRGGSGDAVLTNGIATKGQATNRSTAAD